MDVSINSLSPSQLRKAARLKEKIDSFSKKLAAILNVPVAAAPKQRKRHKMSAAGRARIAAAQRARWAKAKAAKK